MSRPRDNPFPPVVLTSNTDEPDAGWRELERASFGSHANDSHLADGEWRELERPAFGSHADDAMIQTGDAGTPAGDAAVH